ncbi:nuclear transport factor 2 family protein [Mycolicibacterium moriokaense]|nr:nuclear transport factor 2 family protein [Mycolicibacterium moriokaense]
MTADDDIGKLISTYGQALSDGDAAAASACYTDDGWFMPPGAPTMHADKLPKLYQRMFANVTLEVDITIDQLHVINDEYAYAVTQSTSTSTSRSSGDATQQSAREMFVFRNVNHAWKIASYMFNTTK